MAYQHISGCLVPYNNMEYEIKNEDIIEAATIKYG